MPQILSACPAQALKRVKVLPFEARLCLECSVGFNASRLSARQLKSIYDSYLYISPRRGIGASKFEGMFATIRRHLSPADEILEVGCSEGYLLEKLRDAGYAHLSGIEPGPQADEARKIGLDVHRGYFHARSFPGQRFEGIVLMHVFEHFADPVSMLRALKGKLSSSGKLIIEVPDFTGYHHQHLFFYTLSSLRKLAGHVEMKIVEIFEGEGALRLVMVVGCEVSPSGQNAKSSEKKIQRRAAFLMGDLCKTIHKLREVFKTHKKIHWWGAGSSSVFWLNQIGAGILKKTDLIVVDGDRAKWGMFIPGVNVEVWPSLILGDATVGLMIIASEFSEEIKATMGTHRIHARKIEVVT